MSKDPRPDTMRKAEIGIITASREGKLDVVTRLVREDRIPTDYQESEGGPTALMTAAIGGFIAIIIFLLNPGPGIKPAEVNKQDREQRTALINAVLNDKEDCVTYLMENGANPNLYSRNGWTPLYIAANKGYTNIATKLLFQYGRNSPTKGTRYHTLNVDMAIQNTVGGTVLMVASMQGHYQIVESLLRSGADVNVKDKQNWTALMKAADKGNLEVVKLLLANGADVLVADNTGFTALHLAAKAGKEATVEVLLCNSKIDVNTVDKNNRTPLYYAVEKKMLEAVRVLLADPRVDVTIAERVKGGTAVTIATSPDIQALLQAAPRVSGQKADDAVVAGRTEELRREVEGLKISTMSMTGTMTLTNKKRKCDISDPDEETILQMDADYTSGRWLGSLEAVDRILAAAEAGDPCAQAYASLLFSFGSCKFAVDAAAGRAKAKLAMSWLNTSPSSSAKFLLASFLYDGIGLSQDEERALELLQEAAADRTHANSMYALALLYQEAAQTPQTVSAAHFWMHAAAKLGHLAAVFDLGYCCLTGFGGAGADPAEARKFFEKAAALGHGTAMSNLGTMYQHGVGVKTDARQALKYYQDAAAKRDPAGLYNLGICHQDAIATPKDLMKAVSFFQEAALLGHAKAQVEIGVCHYNGTGGAEANETQAVRYFIKAAEQGDPEGLYRYAWCLAKGRGGVRSPTHAAECLRKAAARSHVCASIDLAFLLVQTISTDAARDEARHLLRDVRKSMAAVAGRLGVHVLSGVLPAASSIKVETFEVEPDEPEENLFDVETFKVEAAGKKMEFSAGASKRVVNGSFTRLEMNGTYEMFHLDEADHVHLLPSPPVLLDAQWLLDAAPVLKVALLTLKLSTTVAKPAYLDLALSLVHDPPVDRTKSAFETICPGKSGEILEFAYRTIQSRMGSSEKGEPDGRRLNITPHIVG